MASSQVQTRGAEGSFCSQFEPLRGIDGGFTANSIQIRLPNIVRSVCESSCSANSPDCAVCWLAEEIASDAALPTLPAVSADAENRVAEEIDSKWRHWIQFCQDTSWKTAPWFAVETYAYRLLLRAATKSLPDPFRATKQAALAAAAQAWQSDLAPLVRQCAPLGQDRSSRAELMHKLLRRSLWGNRADLSLSGGAVAKEHLSHQHSSGTQHATGASSLASGLLCDDGAAAVDILLSTCAQAGPASRGSEQCAAASSGPTADQGCEAAPENPFGVMVFADNAGLEILSDLLLIAGLLAAGCPRVTLALKPAPILVSDATPQDLEDTLQWLEDTASGVSASASAARWLSGELRSAVKSNRLVVTTPHWTVSPLPAWDMDNELQTQVRNHAAVVFKGDANYRRLLGDRHVPFNTPAETALSYLATPTIALRTAKSGVLCGVPANTCVQAAIALQPDATPSLEAALVASADSSAGDSGAWSAELHTALLQHDKWLVTGHFGQVQVAGLQNSPL